MTTDNKPTPQISEPVEAVRKALGRLKEGLDAFECDAADAWAIEDRPDLWDQVIEVPISDVRTLIAALSRGEEAEDPSITAYASEAVIADLCAPVPALKASDLEREGIARLLALRGLGTISGADTRSPPNASWTQEEWERRILECVPSSVEQKCREVTDDIFALLSSRPAAPEDYYPSHECLHDLVMLKAQDDIGCVPPPTKEQWSEAWARAEELVRVEP